MCARLLRWFFFCIHIYYWLLFFFEPRVSYEFYSVITTLKSRRNTAITDELKFRYYTLGIYRETSRTKIFHFLKYHTHKTIARTCQPLVVFLITLYKIWEWMSDILKFFFTMFSNVKYKPYYKLIIGLDIFLCTLSKRTRFNTHIIMSI